MDPQKILKVLKDASPLDLFLISFVLLPFIFDAWINVLERLSFSPKAEYISLAIILAGYIIGLIVMLLGSTRERKRDIAKDQIIQHLTSKDHEMISFELIRKKINRSYSDDFLNSLPLAFPNYLRTARLKGAKPGLARIIEAQSENEEQ